MALVLPVAIWAQSGDVRLQVVLETDSGKVVIELYNETPQHRDNFLKLVAEGYYNGVLFHRVIIVPADMHSLESCSARAVTKPTRYLQK